MEAKREVSGAHKEEEEERGADVNNRIGEIAAPSGASLDTDYDDDAGEGGLNAYELERERNIARNRARMEAVVGESKRGFAATTRRAKAPSASGTTRQRRPRRPPPPSPAEEARRVMPTRASRRLRRRSSGSRSPSPDPAQMNRTPPDCGRGPAGALFSRSARPVIPARFVRGVPSARGRGLGLGPGAAAAATDDAEALRQLNRFRTSYMSRAALFNRVMAVSNALKLEDFALVLEGEAGRGDLAALAREKLALMKKGDAAAVKDFVARSKEAEYERREAEVEAGEEEEEDGEGGGGGE